MHADLPPHIHAPEQLVAAWWWLAAGLLLVQLVILAVWWWRRISLRRRAAADDISGMDRLRARAEARLDDIDAAWAQGDIDTAEAHGRISAELRRFVGTADDGHEDFLTLAELRSLEPRHPELAGLISLLGPGYDARFGGAGDLGGRAETVTAAREVIRSWN